jgi:diguanylate cyclase (GGDEF)-like protein
MTASELQKDAFTGLLNRNSFHSELHSVLHTAQAKDQPAALALVDIDHFQAINEQFSHQCGDLVIQAISQTIQQGAGEQAVIARIGGDEFAILFPGKEREQALLKLEHIRQLVEGLHVAAPVDGGEVSGLTISAGVAAFSIDGRTESELTRKVHQALYRAKEGGRNMVRLAYEERMVPKTSHFPQTQLERLSKLAAEHQVGEAELLREALDDLLVKYGVNIIES